MKGTIVDFLKLASENENLGRELGELAAKYDFEFIPPEELCEDELGKVTGGVNSMWYQGAFYNPPPPPPPELTDPTITRTAGSVEEVKLDKKDL